MTTVRGLAALLAGVGLLAILGLTLSPNPQQAEALLEAVGNLPGSGPRMVAFFASMYYAALRPGEAVELAKPNLHIPDEGRGKLFLTGSTPFAGG